MPGSLGLAAEPDGNDLGFVAFVFYDAVRNSVQPGQDLDQLLGSAIAPMSLAICYWAGTRIRAMDSCLALGRGSSSSLSNSEV